MWCNRQNMFFYQVTVEHFYSTIQVFNCMLDWVDTHNKACKYACGPTDIILQCWFILIIFLYASCTCTANQNHSSTFQMLKRFSRQKSHPYNVALWFMYLVGTKKYVSPDISCAFCTIIFSLIFSALVQFCHYLIFIFHRITGYNACRINLDQILSRA